MLTGRFGLTVILIVFDVAGLPVAHVAFEVRIQVTLFPLARAALVYVGEFDPTLAPFSCHWYDGVVPSFTGVAVKVTDVPAQIVVALAAMLTLTGRFGFTVIVTVLDVAGLPDIQVILEVITQLTTSLLDKVLFVYVDEFVPALIPLSFHW